MFFRNAAGKFIKNRRYALQGDYVKSMTPLCIFWIKIGLRYLQMCQICLISICSIFLKNLPEMLAVGGPLNAQGANAKFTER